jgi:hypothetical protein
MMAANTRPVCIRTDSPVHTLVLAGSDEMVMPHKGESGQMPGAATEPDHPHWAEKSQ